MILILLVASFLRWHDLPHTPPGLTHDEADHGIDAWGVVQGERPIYFTVGYGREPLFDYSTAVMMSFLGPTHLAGRLTSVYFSLLLIAGSFAWVRQALGGRVALLTAAGLALGFWPLMTARQALRSETLPALFVLAMALYWQGWQRRELRRQSLWAIVKSPFFWSGLLLGLTFYTYIPARALWLVLPSLLVFLFILRRPTPWRATLLVLGIAALVGLPLFAYLYTHPDAEVRIGQLALPLQQAMQGQFSLLWDNVRSGLGIFTVAGDPQWRYNIAGRPLLTPVGGLLFYAGLLYSVATIARCLWRRKANAFACRRAPALFVVLTWLAIGVAPALATGRELSTTQTIGMQPVLYLFPALALVALARGLETVGSRRQAIAPALTLVALSLGALLLASTWRDYFGLWGSHPAVAVQYERELVTLVKEMDTAVPLEQPVAISSDAPGPFHDAAVARLYLRQPRPLRWFDGRHSLLLPSGEQTVVIFSETAPLAETLLPYFEALQPVPAPSNIAETAVLLTHSPARLLHVYPQISTEINNLSTELSTDLLFGEHLRFLGYEVQSPRAEPGDSVDVVTIWEVQQAPQDDLVLFTHLLDATGAPLAQADRLDAPVHSWQTGDILVQRHTLQLPQTLPSGSYTLAVGAYWARDWRLRLPLTVDGEAAGDVLHLAPLAVQP